MPVTMIGDKTFCCNKCGEIFDYFEDFKIHLCRGNQSDLFGKILSFEQRKKISRKLRG